ncbi:MAG TPA: hypothetical protein VFZ48_01275 [Candidatus Saccharimonadales bacterium]
MMTLVSAADAPHGDRPRVLVVDSEREQRDAWRSASLVANVTLHFCQPGFRIDGVVVNRDPDGIFSSVSALCEFIEALAERDGKKLPLGITRADGLGKGIVHALLGKLMWPAGYITNGDYVWFLDFCAQGS